MNARTSEALFVCLSDLWSTKLTDGKVLENIDAITYCTGYDSSETHSFIPAIVYPPDYVSWVNETAGLGILENFGVFSWKAWRFGWEDRTFNSLCKKNGVLSPAMWWLFDMGKRKT